MIPVLFVAVLDVQKLRESNRKDSLRLEKLEGYHATVWITREDTLPFLPPVGMTFDFEIQKHLREEERDANEAAFVVTKVKWRELDGRVHIKFELSDTWGMEVFPHHFDPDKWTVEEDDPY